MPLLIKIGMRFCCCDMEFKPELQNLFLFNETRAQTYLKRNHNFSIIIGNIWLMVAFGVQLLTFFFLGVVQLLTGLGSLLLPGSCCILMDQRTYGPYK